MNQSITNNDNAPDLGATSDTPTRSRWSVVTVFWGIFLILVVAIVTSFAYYQTSSPADTLNYYEANISEAV